MKDVLFDAPPSLAWRSRSAVTAAPESHRFQPDGYI